MPLIRDSMTCSQPSQDLVKHNSKSKISNVVASAYAKDLHHPTPRSKLPSCLLSLPSSCCIPSFPGYSFSWVTIPQSNVAPSLFIFKVLPDHSSGRLVFARVYSGVISTGYRLFNSTQKVWETVSGIFRVKADRYIKVEKLAVGKCYSSPIVLRSIETILLYMGETWFLGK